MKFLSSVLLAGALTIGASGVAIDYSPNVEAVFPRALPNSPKGYTPETLKCPSKAPAAREAKGLSRNESDWLDIRRNRTVAPMRTLLNRINISDFDVDSFLDRGSKNFSELPNIGLAFSGGGWRALQNGAGAVKAFDSRTANANKPGHLGGLLQSTTYIAGLSGGSWLVGSIFTNNFTTVTALEDDDSEDSDVWEFDNSIFSGPDDGFLSTTKYYADITKEVEGKKHAGFDLSLTDIWGRALSYQLINATDGGPKYTWSSIAQQKAFQNGDWPFPIIIADSRKPGTKIVPENATIFEFNVFEFGSWDPTTYGFIPTQYLGTNFTNGKVENKKECVIGFDNAGFVMGTSATLFNTFLLEGNFTSLPSAVRKLITDILGDLSDDDNDIADYTPNPFYGWNPKTNPWAKSDQLSLVDGGEDNQNIPLHPLIQPDRHVDVIIAVDSSADTTYSWPNGSSLVSTFERVNTSISNGTEFPWVPDTNTFINLGLNTRPTFFGCNTSNFSSGADVPLIVYLPNYPYITYSNESTFQLKTNDTYRDAIIQNGYDVATMANGTRDDNWPTCLGCALISRTLEKTGEDVPRACEECFRDYCWNGTVDSSTPPSYEPTPILGAVDLDP